jgi:tripartite-type tricarboxylate transporter receptor subunit TctC
LNTVKIRFASFFLLMAMGVFIAIPSFSVQAQGYPNKTIKIIVGYPPGGSTDVPARIVGQKLAEVLGQPVVIENKPGASGNIGAELAARAAPDGYTIFWVSIGTAVSASLFPSLSYSLFKDFVAVSQATSVTSFLLVHPSLPVHSVQELINYIKTHPGELSYSSSGTGGSPHLAAEWFKSLANVELVHVAYKGTSPQIVDLLSGTVKVAFPTMPGMIEHVKQGKLRALAVTSPKRSPLLPEIPTMIEAGFDGYIATSWSGAMVPAGTPALIVQQLSVAINQVLAMPDVQQKLAASGADAVGSTPEAFKAFIEAETLKWGKVIKDAKIVNQ